MIAHRLQSLAASEGRAGSITLFDAAADVAGLQTLIVNLYFVGTPGDAGGWVLVDTGMPLFASRVIAAAEHRYGPQARPRAIVLTHGHFDHVGTVRELLRHWDVPVYAHERELPYLRGDEDYLPPDPSVGGGLMARLAAFYPRRGIDLGDRVQALPADGTVPEMPGWRWVHTPGHTPGHVSFFRDSDQFMIAGDAFVTTQQESALAVLAQLPEVHGPPAYFTPDWDLARESVRRLASMHPSAAATGHGPVMRGRELEEGLQRLASEFDARAVPRRGRYVRHPAGEGSRVPWKTSSWRDEPLARFAAAAGLAIGAAALLNAFQRRRA